MAEQANAVTHVLAKQIHTVYLEDDWFKGLLLHVEGVSTEHASRPNPGGTSSAAGQIGHVLYWLRLARRDLVGEQMDGDQDASFTHMQVNNEDWNALRTERKAEVSSFHHDIGRVDEWNQKKLTIVLNQLTHAAYHAGSVVQILKATA
ncbi:hypothetical protein [Deinococcus aquatilis]|uniref:hypothetical protein n=1 Tax=Deinococcus aquatilis TaxID=519440 RepID=UPI00039FD22F|nr:hypothetical protein [Deinococcus aquatilis]